MNEIYWQDKRTMSSKQLSSPPPTQPRRAYENTYQTKHYSPMDTHLNSRSIITTRPITTGRTVHSSHTQYPTVAHRTHPNKNNFPYTSSLHGVYRRSPPTLLTSASRLHSIETRRSGLRNPLPHSQQSQQRPLSRSASEDYYSSRYHESNGFNDEIFPDEDDDDTNENSPGFFQYSYEDTSVSYQK